MESNLIWMEYTLWKHGLSITDTLGLCYMNCRIFRKLGGFAVVDGQLVTGHEQFLATLLCNSISIIMRTLNSQDPQWALTGLSVCLEYERSRNLGRAASCPNLLSTFSSLRLLWSSKDAQLAMLFTPYGSGNGNGKGKSLGSQKAMGLKVHQDVLNTQILKVKYPLRYKLMSTWWSGWRKD